MDRKIVLAAALVVATPAFAADWSGPYVGGFVGTQSGTDTFTSDETNTRQALEPSGTAFGLMLGFNTQKDAFVFGTEFEIGFGTADDFIEELAANNTFGYDMTSEIGDTYRLRARFGYEVMDGFLPFVAAGVSSASTTVTSGCATCTPVSDPIDVNRIGFSIGLGLDWAFAENMSVRAEYFTEDFGSAVYNSYDVVGDTWDMNLSLDTFRLGFAYRF